jgi:hypothetical protein
MLRPLGFGEDKKIDLMRLSVGIPVLIAFALSFTILKWSDVLIYTFAFRLGIFIILTLIPLLIPFVKQFNGYLFFISYVLTIIALLYYFIFSLIL